MSKHFVVYGSPVLERYWSWTIRYQAWALFSLGWSCRSVGKGVQHKTTVHVGCITLIAHRTSDTEKKNILSVFENPPFKWSPLKITAFTIKLKNIKFFQIRFSQCWYNIQYTRMLCAYTDYNIHGLTNCWLVYLCCCVKWRTISTSNVTFSHFSTTLKTMFPKTMQRS